MIVLPTEPKKATRDLVKSMLIVSRPKMGKTSALMQLPKSLLIDLEDSSEYFDGTAINVMAECVKEGKGPIRVLKMITAQIKEANKAAGDFVYDYGIIDTVTKLEEICEPYATALYKKSPQGQNYTGDNVMLDLEYGGGYMYLRKAVKEMIAPFFQLFKTVIFTGHVKDSSLTLKGKNMSVADINLTGKIKGIICSKCDSIGTLYRHEDKENTNVLSFVTHSADILTGARPAHLGGKEFEISTYNPVTKEFNVDWSKIFIDNN